MKGKYDLFSTQKQDDEAIKKYGSFVPIHNHYGWVIINGTESTCEKVKKILEKEFRLE